ncbi:YjdF family protein [Liquorilactobacillus uvarum]|uniref:YjdF family protein n=1 Tax=Liquorilactobacillus uvarum TaxID=303240 RepID=UPI002889F69B|nr:YjdF family protein [Liquorilactobacillus uvarum]
MLTIRGSLTIIYEPPFYKGIFEEETQCSYRVAQFNFGTSVPKTRLVYLYLLAHYSELTFYEQKQKTKLCLKHANPKRLQRLARKNVGADFRGTKAQQALQKQHQSCKRSGKKQRNLVKKNKKQFQYEQRKNKRLQKHKGH